MTPDAPAWPPPAAVLVVVEVPRGGRVKWGADGGIDYISPLGSPFAYGSVEGLMGQDGDPLDALVLGAGLRRGDRVPCRVAGRVRFVDDGAVDDKWICLPAGRRDPPARGELLRVRAFFRAYALVKAAWHRLRGRAGPTRLLAVELLA